VIPGPSSFPTRARFFLLTVLTVIAALAPSSRINVSTLTARAQSPLVDRPRGEEMLKQIKQDLKDYYYDPTFHGINIDARFKEAERQMKKATSTAQIFGIIAQVLLDLNDSHTRFTPPGLVDTIDYGWRMQMIGDRCYVVAIKKGSDAAEKGLKLGDEIYSIDGFAPERDSFWKLYYSYYVLAPAVRLVLEIRDPDQTLRRIEVTPKQAKIEKIFVDPDEVHLPLYREIGDDVIVCKLREFYLSDKNVDEMMKKIGPHKALILDLRGNHGGSAAALQRLLGHFFDHDVKVSDAKGRKESRAEIAKTRGDRAFKGRLVVLVDSESKSASEMFARVIQLEKRGTVIGDRTLGRVMGSYSFGHELGYLGFLHSGGRSPSSFYGVSVTVVDIIMSDGKRLENTGVLPDEIALPTGSDLAARRDPVLARAAALMGIELDPQKAGTLFPPDDETEVTNKEKKAK